MAELNVELARNVARSARARVEQVKAPRGSEHAFSLDTIAELAAMVLNLADRVGEGASPSNPIGDAASAFLDAGDAGRAGEEWLTAIARTVGIERGRIERFNGRLGETGADNCTVVLWDGPKPRACYMLLRDEFNRSKLIRWQSPSGAAPAARQGDEKDAARYRWLRDKSIDHKSFADSVTMLDGHGIKVVYQMPHVDARCAPVGWLSGDYLDAMLDTLIERKVNSLHTPEGAKHGKS